MSSIVISETEIKVNGYSVGAVAGVGFEYQYLYYEPEVGNAFKIMPTSGGTYKADLNSAEVQMCQDFCDAFVPPSIAVPSADVVEELDSTMVYVVTPDASSYEKKPRFLVQPHEIEITESEAFTRALQSWDYPRFEWDTDARMFVPVDTSGKRVQAYMRSFNFGDQLDIIWKAVRAMRDSGVSMPEEVDAALNTISSIKLEYPL